MPALRLYRHPAHPLWRPTREIPRIRCSRVPLSRYPAVRPHPEDGCRALGKTETVPAHSGAYRMDQSHGTAYDPTPHCTGRSKNSTSATNRAVGAWHTHSNESPVRSGHPAFGEYCRRGVSTHRDSRAIPSLRSANFAFGQALSIPDGGPHGKPKRDAEKHPVDGPGES